MSAQNIILINDRTLTSMFTIIAMHFDLNDISDQTGILCCSIPCKYLTDIPCSGWTCLIQATVTNMIQQVLLINCNKEPECKSLSIEVKFTCIVAT